MVQKYLSLDRKIHNRFIVLVQTMKEKYIINLSYCDAECSRVNRAKQIKLTR